MPSTDELFGTDEKGQPLVNIRNVPNEARRDVVLEVCYRNTPWALATAHALGFGIYRQPGGLVQHFDDYDLWEQIGYEVVHGELSAGERVTLSRSKSSYPEFFDRLLEPSDAVVLQTFDSEAAHDEWLAREIEKNIREDALEFDDILIVIPESYTSKKRASRIALALGRRNIPAHNVGVNSSAEEVFIPGSVAMTHIFRAKGNEAPMVYVVDAQYAVRGTDIVARRNVLFTAITRSRAWVRISGHGKGMQLIASEVRAVRDNAFKLDFKLPTRQELDQIRRVHRDPRQPSKSAKRIADKLYDVLEQLDSGEIEVADLPTDVRDRLLRMLGPQ